MNIKVHLADLKPEEQNMQTGILATESVRCQKIQQPRASASLAASGKVSYPQTEDLIAEKEMIFQSVARTYLQATSPRSIEEYNTFEEYLSKMKLIICGVSLEGSLITVKCESLMILEEL